jgi:ABC-type antimicrobial peptide transport system ATPase subunit
MFRAALRVIAGLVAVSAAGCSAFAQAPITIEQLVQDNWEVAGYVSAFENRSLILFKHKDQKYLVQCSVLVDVLRSPRLVITCYELR